MRIRSSFLILLIGMVAGCSGSKSTTEESILRSVAQPMDLVIDTNPEDQVYNSKAVAKVYRSNAFVQSGAFISSNGLFMTNFPIALEYFTTLGDPSIGWLTDGYLSDENNPELPLPNVSFMIEVEQIDVSDRYNDLIKENSSNRDIAQIKQSVTQKIIQSEKNSNPELVVQINELFNGQRFILSKFQVLRDIRLAFAPATGISSDDITDSNQILSKLENLPVFLRAYVQADGSPATFSNDNIPYSTTDYFTIDQSSIKSTTAQVVGFPDRSFRLDPLHALIFYNKSTNPKIIKSYSAFLDKEERLSWKNPLYAHRSIANRTNVQQSLNYYENVQRSFELDSILHKKMTFDDQLKEQIQSDSAISSKYGVIFSYLDEAYDIASRQGESFYAASYFLALSQLDEFAMIVREYLNSTSDEPTTRMNRLLNSQAALLARTNVQEELLQLADFITIFNELPRPQIPFSIQDIFDANPDFTSSELAEYVLLNFGNETALFDSTKLADSVSENRIDSDPLFMLLDELIFVQEMSRNNQAIFIAYAQPVQKVYNDAIRELINNTVITSDANGILRTNQGFVIPESDSGLRGFFNFTTKAFGSSVINRDGKLIGIFGDELTTDVTGNYLFNNHPDSYPVIRISTYLQQVERLNPNSYLLKELNN